MELAILHTQVYDEYLYVVSILIIDSVPFPPGCFSRVGRRKLIWRLPDDLRSYFWFSGLNWRTAAPACHISDS